MADIRQCGIALERYRNAHGGFPITEDLEELRALLLEFSPVPERDAWGHPWQIEVSSSGYTLAALANLENRTLLRQFNTNLGARGGSQPDIVYSDGEFVRWPEGVQVSREMVCLRSRSSGPESAAATAPVR